MGTMMQFSEIRPWGFITVFLLFASLMASRMSFQAPWPFESLFSCFFCLLMGGVSGMIEPITGLRVGGFFLTLFFFLAVCRAETITK